MAVLKENRGNDAAVGAAVSINPCRYSPEVLDIVATLDTG
jgi:hypothetical protein